MAHSIYKAYQWAVDTCNDPNVGYSATSWRYAITVNGITYYDCSSFIYYALIAGGWTTDEIGSEAFYTGNEAGYLLNAGFEEISPNGEIKAGDIGLNRNSTGGHTEMCYTGGYGAAVFMGAQTNENTALANQVCIGSSKGDETYTRTFERLFRCSDSDMPDEEPISHNTSNFDLRIASAILGNWWDESLINPGVWESLVPCNWDYIYSGDDIGGYGLGQWTNTDASNMRCYNLYKWLRNNGYAVDSGNGQCAYYLEEQYWSPKSGYDITTWADFMSDTSHSLAELTEAFMRCWEGLSSDASKRQGNAETIYNYLSEHMADSVTWTKGNKWISETALLSNAVCVYQYFNSNWQNNGASKNGDDDGDTWDSGLTDTPDYNTQDVALTWGDIWSSLFGGAKNNGDKKIHIKKRR